METNNPFNDTIEKMNKNIDALDEETRKLDKERDDSNDESSDKESENTNPAYIIYKAISDSSIEMLQSKEVVDTFKVIANAVGEDVSKKMVEMFAILLTQSAYSAVMFYDGLLSKVLESQFNHFAESINTNKADIEGHHSALKVFKKQLGEIQNKLNIENFQSENHITPDPNKP